MDIGKVLAIGRKMLHDVLQFFFHHLFSWDQTTDVSKRSLGPVEEKGVTFRRDTVRQQNEASRDQGTAQKPTPSHVTELALKALLGPEEQPWWPARPTFHKTWPEQLQGYQRVYEAIGPHLINEQPSMDDAENRQIIDNFRNRCRHEYSTHTRKSEVQTLLEDDGCMSEPAWQGFYACIAYQRHYYRYAHFGLLSKSAGIQKSGRWGVSPIVHVAQQEKTLEIPEELELPWRALKRHFRINGQGGNLSSNVYFAFNDRPKLEFSCCWGLSDDHIRTEHWTDYLFVGMEDLVSPEQQSGDESQLN